MKAMILAAGFGTRLRPLTDTCPKALVVLRGHPIVSWVIARLAGQGYTDIILNAHHFSEQMVTFVERYNAAPPNVGSHLTLSREEVLLDTGGGLEKASWFFDDREPFVVHTSDVLSDLDLKGMMRRHQSMNALVTLAVKKRPGSRFFLLDKDMRLCGWKSDITGKTRIVNTGNGPLQPFPSMAIQIMCPDIFTRWKVQPPFSLTDAILDLAAAGEPVYGFEAPETRWMDIGRFTDFQRAAGYFGDAYFEGLSGGTKLFSEGPTAV